MDGGSLGVGLFSLSPNLYYRYIIREIHLHGIICTHSLNSLWAGGFTSQTLENTVNWKETLASLNPIASPFLNQPTMHRSPPHKHLCTFCCFSQLDPAHSFIRWCGCDSVGNLEEQQPCLMYLGLLVCLCRPSSECELATWGWDSHGRRVVRRRNTHGRMPPTTTTTAQTQHHSLAVYIQNYYCAAPPHRVGEKSETTSLDTRLFDSTCTRTRTGGSLAAALSSSSSSVSALYTTNITLYVGTGWLALTLAAF